MSGHLATGPAQLVLVTPFGPWHPVVPLLFRMLDAGECGHALEAIQKWEHLVRACGDTRTLGFLLAIRARALTELGRYSETLVVDEELVRMHRASGWTIGEVKALADSATGLMTVGRGAEGLVRLARAVWLLESCVPAGQRYVSAVLSVAVSAQLAELFETAAETLARLLAELSTDLAWMVRRDPGQLDEVKTYYADILLEWGLRLEYLGRPDEARSRWTRSLELLDRPNKPIEPDPLSAGTEALVLAKLGRSTEALDLVGRRMQQVKGIDGSRVERVCRLAAGMALRCLGDLDGAFRELTTAQSLWQFGGTGSDKIVLAQELAAVALDRMTDEGQKAVLKRALLAHIERLEDFRLQGLTTLRRARAREQSDHERALLDRTLREDPLTCLGNRRRFDEQLARVADSRGPMSLLLIDIDEFKAVNDDFLHLIGDQVLCAIADTLRAITRAGDVAIRLGGDEFALFAQLSAAAAEDMAEQIRSDVEHRDWDALARGLRVTISVGVATKTGPRSGAELFATADRRLYDAKRAGRNRVAGEEQDG